MNIKKAKHKHIEKRAEENAYLQKYIYLSHWYYVLQLQDLQ